MEVKSFEVLIAILEGLESGEMLTVTATTDTEENHGGDVRTEAG